MTDQRLKDLENTQLALTKSMEELKQLCATLKQETAIAMQNMAKAKQAMDHAQQDAQALRKRIQKLEGQQAAPPNPQEPKRRGRPPGAKNKRTGGGEPKASGTGEDMGAQAQAT